MGDGRITPLHLIFIYFLFLHISALVKGVICVFFIMMVPFLNAPNPLCPTPTGGLLLQFTAYRLLIITYRLKSVTSFRGLSIFLGYLIKRSTLRARRHRLLNISIMLLISLMISFMVSPPHVLRRYAVAFRGRPVKARQAFRP